VKSWSLGRRGEELVIGGGGVKIGHWGRRGEEFVIGGGGVKCRSFVMSVYCGPCEAGLVRYQRWAINKIKHLLHCAKRLNGIID